MQLSHIAGSRPLARALVFAGLFLTVILEATAQSPAKNPSQPKNGNVLPPPGSPYTVTNKDGSTTTTTNSPMGGTQVVTKDAHGRVISTVYKASTVSGGQSIT